MLDSVSEEVAHLQGALPQADRTKLTEYLDAIRDVEQRIQIAEEQSDQELPLVDHPAGIPAGWEDHVKLMFDLQVLAYQCDLTRVITLMVGHEHSGMTYPQIGVPDAHHPISHHQQEPEKVAKVAKINAYHVQMFAHYLEKLQATPDGDGTLLDHMTMMYGAGIADSNSHSPIDIPMILAGGGAGHLKGGRHIRFKNMPLANLHLTLLDQFGVHWDRIGDSTGRVDAQDSLVCSGVGRGIGDAPTSRRAVQPVPPPAVGCAGIRAHPGRSRRRSPAADRALDRSAADPGGEEPATSNPCARC